MQLCLMITNDWLEVRKAAYLLVQRSKERGNKRERERDREKKRKGKHSTGIALMNFSLGQLSIKEKKKKGEK